MINLRSKSIWLALRFIGVILVILLFQINTDAQRVIFSDPGRTHNDTDGPTLDVYGPVNVTTCSSIRIELDYSFSLPWEGGGNMETSDECNFMVPPCAGDPRSPLGPCANCWDFLWVQFMMDGAEVGSELIGEAGTTNAEQRGSISFERCTMGAATAGLNITTQTWAGNEAVTFSSIMIICFEGKPTAEANPNPICDDEILNLRGRVTDPGVVTNSEWRGPGDIDDPFSLNTTVTNIPPGPATYTIITTDVNGCNSSDEVMVVVHPTPMSFPAGPLEECSMTGQAVFDLTQLNTTVSGGSGDPVIWYRDAGTSSMIPNPAAFLTGSTTVYVVVDNGFCESEVIEVELIVKRTPDAQRAMAEKCEEISGSGRATFDLSELDDAVAGGQADVVVTYYSDAMGLAPVPSPFSTGTTIIFARVEKEGCLSALVQINLTVNSRPDGQSFNLRICEDPPGSGMTTVDLTEHLDSLMADMGVTITFYEDQSLLVEITQPYMASIGTNTVYAVLSDGRCESEPIAITIEVLTTPSITGTTLSVCEDPPGSGRGVFELDSIVDVLIGSQLGVVVRWYADAQGTILFDKNYTGGDTVVYAIVDNGACTSELLEIQLTTIAPPNATSYSDTLCGDSDNRATFTLEDYDFFIANDTAEEEVIFVTDTILLTSAPQPFYTGDTSVFAQVRRGACPSEWVEIRLVVVQGARFFALMDLVGCDSVILPAIAGVNLSGNQRYFSGKNGNGTSYGEGDIIKSGGRLYMYDQTAECEITDSVNITIQDSPDPGESRAVSICGGTVINLLDVLQGEDPGGTLRDDSLSMALSGTDFNSTGLEGRTFQFTYKVDGQAPCQGDSSFIIIDVVDEVSAGLDTIISICQGDTVDLMSILREADAGGIFMDNNSSGGLTGSTFHSNRSGIGQFNISYQVGDGVVCPEDESVMTINVTEGVEILQINDVIACGYYILPAINGSNILSASYHTLAQGMGIQMSPGDTIFTDQTVYILARNGQCEDEISFDIEIREEATYDLNATVCADSSIIVGSEVFDINRPNGTVTLDNAAAGGCDSIVSVRLDFHSESRNDINRRLCFDEFLMVNGVRYDRNNPTGTEVLASQSQNGCDSTVVINLTFIDASHSIDTTLCEGDFLMVNGEMYDINNPAGTEIIQNGGQSGCDSIIDIQINFEVAGRLTIRRDLCFGQQIILNQRVYDENNPTGMDTIFGGSLSGCDSIIDVSLNFQAVADTLIVADLCQSDTVIINGRSYFEGNMTGVDTLFGGSASGCDSVIRVSINVIQAGQRFIDEQLCPEDFIIINGSRYDINRPSGQEIIVGSSPNGCDSIYIVQLNFEDFNLTPTREEHDILLGDSVQVLFQTDLPYTQISWSDDQGVSCLDCLNPVIKPTQTATYIITFIDENGCELTATILIRVTVNTDVYVPNTFSPNGDNINDRHQIFSKTNVVKSIQSYRVFSRWGELVYQEVGTNPDDGTHLGWDGTFNGQELPPDVFVYHAIVELSSGEVQNLSGSLTLVE